MTFGNSAADRVGALLAARGQTGAVEPLTPDASTREYFRITLDGVRRVACAYPEPINDDLPFLDTTKLFLSAGVPVAEIIEVDRASGIVIQEDLGHLQLSEALKTSSETTRERRINEAISIIARIQAATDMAFERNSVAARLRFDREKLEWELGFFLEHHFGSLLKRPLNKALETSVRTEFSELAGELESYSRVLTHRDFHASNLMVGDDGTLKVIDHQDARIGSAAYDLVSLLLDRITEPPDGSHLQEKRELFLSKRTELGLETIQPDRFAYEFDLVSVQRCLKAIGTFSNQAGNFGKAHYTVFIEPMFGVIAGVCRKLGRFPATGEMVLFARGEI